MSPKRGFKANTTCPLADLVGYTHKRGGDVIGQSGS